MKKTKDYNKIIEEVKKENISGMNHLFKKFLDKGYEEGFRDGYKEGSYDRNKISFKSYHEIIKTIITEFSNDDFLKCFNVSVFSMIFKRYSAEEIIEKTNRYLANKKIDDCTTCAYQCPDGVQALVKKNGCTDYIRKDCATTSMDEL